MASNSKVSAQNADPALVNMQARSLILGNGVRMVQQVQSITVDPTQVQTLNFQAKPVGLLTGFIVEVTANLNNPAGAQVNRTNFGTANLLSNVTFTDLYNVQRINTAGWHLALLNAARQGFPLGSTFAPNIPMNFGNNYSPFIGPASIPAATASTQVRHIYHVPIAYSPTDLRGSIYSAIVNGVQNLSVTLNSAPVIAGGGDPLNAVYQGNAGGYVAGASVTVNVYQVFIDQLPSTNQGPILPNLDINTIYEVKMQTYTGMAVGSDFPIDYANQRQFLSTCLVFDNGGTFNAGSDLDYLMLQAANATPLWKLPPEIVALHSRALFMCDTPPGSYWLDHRGAPIDTVTWGNMALVLHANTVNAGAKAVVGFEDFSISSTIQGAASLQ